MAQPSSISLTILRKGDTNIIDLAEVGSLIPRSETRVDDAFLQELITEVRSVAAPGYSQGAGLAVVQELQRLGGMLFAHLLTEPARQRLRTAPSCDLYLRLDEALLQVPWELCYDGEQFLANKFRLGRQVITSSPLPSSRTARRRQGALRVLVIADPTETLPQASKEAERLCELLGMIKGVDVSLLGGREVRRVPLLAALETHEVVHFAGHSQYDAQIPSQSGWVLHEGMLTAGELSKLGYPPLLVFSNSCQAGTTVAWQGSYRYEGQAFGIGSAFLLAGVSNYIGTLWAVPDDESFLFATAFYRSLTAGQNVGEALDTARQAVVSQGGWQNQTWASYMLYGDPAFTLLPPTKDHTLALPSTAEQLQPVGVLQRKLAAILSADVKGYSRLMGEDEEATIRTLTAYREVMATLIQQHQGRVVDAPGDNLLAEFASAVDAVQCAVEIQKKLKAKNAELPLNRRMEFRLGLNIGDVIVEGERIYGDGVNIAARVEALAEGGGICISGTAYDQVKNKLVLVYEYMGDQAVKNIAEPVRVYRIPVDESPRHKSSSQEAERQRAKAEAPKPRRLRLSPLWMGAGFLLFAVIFVAVRYFPFLFSRPQPLTPSSQTALPLPLKPSIAVLPFVNMSEDPKQEYFSDGMTDTLITDLSKLSGLFVIARNSTFAYKGKAIKPQQVSQELGVRYVVEGSVQKADARVRINAQLVDATTGHHLWAERYDRELKDIFALQDELARRIVNALQVRLTAEEQGRVGQIPTDNLEAYDYYLRGMEYFWRLTQEATVQARQMFEKAVTLDPQFALAYTWLGQTYLVEWVWLWDVDPQTIELAFNAAQKALSFDEALPAAYDLLGQVYVSKGQLEQGLAAGEQSLALDSNCARCYVDLAEILLLAGRPEEAVGLVEKAMRLDPQSAAYSSATLGWAYRLLGRYEEAIAAQKRALTRNPN